MVMMKEKKKRERFGSGAGGMLSYIDILGWARHMPFPSVSDGGKVNMVRLVWWEQCGKVLVGII